MAYISQTIFSLVKPAVQSLAGRLFVLTSGRDGSQKYRPTVNTFYETGIVTALYEHLLMSPLLQHLEIRHEMPYHGPVGAPKRVDLWLRPVNGGHPTLVEAGDFAVGKVHEDLKKISGINPNGTNWFLAFFRDPGETKPQDPWAVLRDSFARANGLDTNHVEADPSLVTHFEVYRPTGDHDTFGVALLKGL
ncbi:MAG: hypothetical protein HZA88_15255 [Verrucomicrobia bacterium]|nr:hypothetical protein [Verrucomicrobiota bacterium]